MSLTA